MAPRGPAFADDYRVVLFDHVGTGGSDLAAYDATRYGGLGGYAADVLEICAALDLRDVMFVGHSVSATVGLLAAARAPGRFARLVLVGPSPCYRNVSPDYAGGFERDQLDALLDLMDQDRDGFARYLAPVVAGADAPAAVGEYVHRHLAGSTPHRLRATGHAPHLSHPEETATDIRAYLGPRAI